ncbi:hypothetical protein IW261DRAFT_352748 [Armillaria novae-zelandiae]|uniref:Uncharacterized protein n=1 Tax=Armillaria novae-zelandiae TaxID=153914 RepID=A0AA39PQR8_9AGAR|nr:hypothetical protein IW261DRAFT_352748 [Armillaria novae-zelandiae]
MEICEIFLLDDDYLAKDYAPSVNLPGSVIFPHQVKETTGTGTEIFDLSSKEDSTKIEIHTSGDGFSDIKHAPVKQEAIDITIDALLDAKKPVKQEIIDLTGLGSESDDENICASRNDEDAFASSTTTSAIDVSHLFDFSSTNFLPGPAFMDEDEDSDDTNWVGIFHSPLRSPQALLQTPTRSEKYSLRPRPKPSAYNTPSWAKSPPAKRRMRANKENHGNAEENPGWKKAYEALLKRYNRLQKDYDVLMKRLQIAKVDAQRGGTLRSPSRRALGGISAPGSGSLMNQEPGSPEPHVSNVYSLLS